MKARELEYAAILYELPDKAAHEEESLFEKYKGLYTDIIINKGEEIIDIIRNWSYSNPTRDKGRLKIKNKILTYQQVSKDNPDYMEGLPLQIKEFYSL